MQVGRLEVGYSGGLAGAIGRANRGLGAFSIGSGGRAVSPEVLVTGHDRMAFRGEHPSVAVLGSGGAGPRTARVSGYRAASGGQAGETPVRGASLTFNSCSGRLLVLGRGFQTRGRRYAVCFTTGLRGSVSL